MKRVFIDRENGDVMVEGRKIPRLLLRMIRGGVGKSFVVKHYKGGKIVVTKFPDMSGIVASEQQRVRRDLFREAVVYAKWIVGDEERKKAFRKTLPRKKQKHVYQAAIRLYMRMEGDARWLRKQLAVRAMLRSGVCEIEKDNRQLPLNYKRSAFDNSHKVNRDVNWGSVNRYPVECGHIYDREETKRAFSSIPSFPYNCIFEGIEQ